MAAALGDLDDGASPGRGDATALGKDAEAVFTPHRRSVDDQFLSVVEDDDDPVGAGVPCTRRVGETLRPAVQPVQAADRQEPVRVGEPGLLSTVPVQPVLGEGLEVCCGRLCGHEFHTLLRHTRLAPRRLAQGCGAPAGPTARWAHSAGEFAEERPGASAVRFAGDLGALSDEERAALKDVLARCPELDPTAQHIRDFGEILTNRIGPTLLSDPPRSLPKICARTEFGSHSRPGGRLEARPPGIP
ncbi:hypothetical protein GCM10010339_83400 [Streptomyces alanosinicus]|uniref:Uncharacterized protein n=1 Tax=Streptomyces alanosinicus TaxID=68171 RepID=A0A919D7Z7_9ACTN|nr:hypothetical protein GCM10010339_83400 [Streptomyces alanosinicus]